jgi:hypothetical protein
MYEVPKENGEGILTSRRYEDPEGTRRVPMI